MKQILGLCHSLAKQNRLKKMETLKEHYETAIANHNNGVELFDNYFAICCAIEVYNFNEASNVQLCLTLNINKN
ncbi:MAG: hypothetical protein GVY19_12565 [Bacteroidetes bacterium]|jgi:hypothetical protein|nr:hypothetical protein [Bacteroidota bacterium]